MKIPGPFHYRHRRTVEFADTDMAGIMHFSNHLRFVESAEHAFFQSLGERVHTEEAAHTRGWPKVEVSCRYLKPARFGDALEICLRIDEIRTSSLRYGFWIFAVKEPERPLIAHGTCSIIHVKLDTKARAIRKMPIPRGLREKLRGLAARRT